MADLLLKIENNIYNLQKALGKSDYDLVDRYVEILATNLLDNENYKKLGDERALSRALQLLSETFGKEKKYQLNPLYQWFDIIRDINDKFFSIIDHNTALGELLFSK